MTEIRSMAARDIKRNINVGAANPCLWVPAAEVGVVHEAAGSVDACGDKVAWAVALTWKILSC